MLSPHRAVSRSLAGLPDEASRSWAGDPGRPGLRHRGGCCCRRTGGMGCRVIPQTPFELGRLGTIAACQERGHPLGGLSGTVDETRVPANTKAPCLSERRPAETAEPPRRSRTATGTQSSPLRSEPGSRSTPLTRMTGKKSPAGPLSRTRSSIATERSPGTAGETRQDRLALAVRAGWILCPMPGRRVTCGDCGASRTFPDGDWEKVQRGAVDAWAEAHQQDAHDGKAVSGWDLDPNPVFGRD